MRPERWAKLPGNFDSLNARTLFTSDNEWGIPALAREPLAATPPWLAPFGTRMRSQSGIEGALHFFLDDYRFERVWSRAREALQTLRLFPTALTPDFSLYRDWPLTLQLWNTYRNRWCGCYWQSQGLAVIPTISWSTAESFAFAFCGVPQHSLVAVATVGVRLDLPAERARFMDGFREMVARLSPSQVLCYGPPPEETRALAPIHAYPTRWTTLAAARREVADGR